MGGWKERLNSRSFKKAELIKQEVDDRRFDVGNKEKEWRKSGRNGFDSWMLEFMVTMALPAGDVQETAKYLRLNISQVVL